MVKSANLEWESKGSYATFAGKALEKALLTTISRGRGVPLDSHKIKKFRVSTDNIHEWPR